MCQCPKRANLISTETYVEPEDDDYEVCQCPKRANLISTERAIRHAIEIAMCVNALNGLISFLRSSCRSDSSDVFCVNALNGLISFLRKLYLRRYDFRFVSMP